MERLSDVLGSLVAMGIAHMSNDLSRSMPPIGAALEPVLKNTRCLGVALFGSYARDTATRSSDMDVLVLHDGRPPEEIIDDLPEMVSVAFYDGARFSSIRTRSPLFADHLAREARLLRDDRGQLAAVLRHIGPMNEECARVVEKASRRRVTSLIQDHENGRAEPSETVIEAYALGKQLAMLDAARSPAPVYDRAAAFEHLVIAHPELEDATSTLCGVEQHWLWSRNARSGPDMPRSLLESASRQEPDVVQALNAVLRTVCRGR